MDDSHERELAERGFTVIPAFCPPALTRAAREMVDRLLGPAAATIPEERRQAGPWPQFPVLPADRPLVTTGSYRHSVMHPIHDPLPARILAEPAFVELYQRLLRCPDPAQVMASLVDRIEAVWWQDGAKDVITPLPRPGAAAAPAADVRAHRRRPRPRRRARRVHGR
jgi:hypothetical protein